MSTMEEVHAAERVWMAADQALREYINRPAEAKTDIGLHVRLADQLREALNAYARVVKELGR